MTPGCVPQFILPFDMFKISVTVKHVKQIFVLLYSIKYLISLEVRNLQETEKNRFLPCPTPFTLKANITFPNNKWPGMLPA